MNIKQILVLCIFILISVIGISLSNGTPKESEPTISIAVSTTPLSAPIIIAQQLALFDKFNVKVELEPTQGGHACFDKLISGKVDLATSSESVVMFNSFHRSDFAVLASFVESNNDIKLLTLNDSGLSLSQNLDGKKFGMVKSSASEFFLYAYLILTGNGEAKIEQVFLEPEQLAPALLAGKVDAISIWEPIGYRLKQEFAEKVYAFPSKGVYNLSFNLIAMKSTINEQEQSYVNILAAIGEAQRYIQNQPEQAKLLVSDYLKIPIEQLNWGWDDYLFRLSLSNVLISNLRTQARWAIATKSVNNVDKIPDFRLVIESKVLMLSEAL